MRHSRGPSYRPPTPTRRRWDWFRFRPRRPRWPRSSRFRPIPRATSSGPAGGASRRWPAVPIGDDTPETWEHSLEVQLPLSATARSRLQHRAGGVRAGRSAEGGREDHSLSRRSDADRRQHRSEPLPSLRRGQKTRHADRQGDLRSARRPALRTRTPAATPPICTLIDIARRKGWKAQLLDYRNSGDTSGDKTARGGLCGHRVFRDGRREAFAGVERARNSRRDERRFLLELARKSVSAAVTGSDSTEGGRRRAGEAPRPPGVLRHAHQERRTPRLHRQHLSRGVALRGGDPPGEVGGDRGPAVPSRACATNFKRLKIEISVLTVPKPLEFTSPQDLLAKLRPGVDGVVLEVDGHKATFLPQVWEQLPDKRAVHERACAEGRACLPTPGRGRARR